MARVGVRLALCCLSLILVLGCSSIPRGEVISSVPAQDGQSVLILQRRDGGATTAFAYDVILQASESGSNRQLVFSSYAYPVPTEIGFSSTGAVEIRSEEGDVYVIPFDSETLEPAYVLEFYRGEETGS